MARLFLLDTNIVSNFIRYPNGPAAVQIRRYSDGELCSSVIVLAELYFGAEKVRSHKLRQRIDEAVALFAVLPLQLAVIDHYAQIRAFLEVKGLPIGGNDMFIAAHARSLDLTLITDNIREFSRVPNLRVENWLD